MAKDTNERRAARIARIGEIAKAVEQLAAQARATIADWETRARVGSRSPEVGNAAQQPHCAGPVDRLAQLEGELFTLRRDAEEATRSIVEESRQADAWEARAMLAVEEGRDDLARYALERYEKHRDSIEALLEELRVVDAIMEEYGAALANFHDQSPTTPAPRDSGKPSSTHPPA